MPRNRKSDFEFRQEASLSQQLAARDPVFEELSGTDEKTSEAIGVLHALEDNGLIDLKEPGMKLMMDLMNAMRKAHFATSEQTDTITKLGLQMGRMPDVVDIEEEDDVE